MKIRKEKIIDNYHAITLTLSVFEESRWSRKKVKGYIEIDQERCKGCSFCIEYCPKKAIVLTDKLNLKGYFVAAYKEDNGCTGCAICAIMCPEVAIEVYRGEAT